MSAEEADLQRELRLMAYLDRQLPAEEARQLEAELAADPTLRAKFDEFKSAFGGLDRLFDTVSQSAESRTPPDWRQSLAGAQAQLQALRVDVATPTPPLPATARAKMAILPTRRAGNVFTRYVTAAAAVAAAAVLLVFAMQATPYLTLTPQAAPPDPYRLPAPLPVTVAPGLNEPVQPAADTLTAEDLIQLGLSPAQADQLLRDGVLLLTHNELPAWKAAGLDPFVAFNGRQLPTYLTADAVYNLFLVQMHAAAERFDQSQPREWTTLFQGCQAELKALRAERGFEAEWNPAADRLAALLATGEALARADAPTPAADAATQAELQRLATAADGVDSPLLMRTVDYSWIRQHPTARLRRWLGFVGTAQLNADDTPAMTAALKLWWAILQRRPTLWSQYSNLALKIRAEEAGTAAGRDLLDLHAEFTALCGDNDALRFTRLMRGAMQAAARPIGFLPPSTPFRNDLAAAMGAQHSFIDAVLIHPRADTAAFVGAQGRLKRLLAYRESQGADSAIARWNQLFDSIAKPAPAWPFSTPAWREKSDRLLAAAWVGTPIRPHALPADLIAGRGGIHYDRFEAAPDFYNRLQAICAERAATLAADDPHQPALKAVSQWLATLTQASLDQLAGRPQTGIDLPAAALSAPAGDQPETDCRVALKIASADAGPTDLILGNELPAQVLLLQPDATGAVRVFVGAVSRPCEGLAAHDPAGPQAAWRKLTEDGTRSEFHYNGR